jgi:hypothetical protein
VNLYRCQSSSERERVQITKSNTLQILSLAAEEVGIVYKGRASPLNRWGNFFCPMIFHHCGAVILSIDLESATLGDENILMALII